MLGTTVDAEVRFHPSSLLFLPETPHQISPSSPKSQTDPSSCHPLNTVAYNRHPSYCGWVPTERKLYVGREAYERRKVPQCPVVRCLFCMCERSSSPIQRHLWTDSWLQPTGLNAQRNQEISREGTWGRDSGSSPHLPALPTHLSSFSHFLPSSRCGWEQHLPWCSVTIKLPPLLWFSKSMMMESSVTSTKVRKFLPWSVMRNQMFMDLLGSLVSWYPALP